MSTSTVAGDRLKAYILALHCRNLLMLQKNYQNTVISERGSPNFAVETGLAGACEGVTQAQLAASYENLKIALHADVPGAAVQYYSAGPLGDIETYYQRPDDPIVKDWKVEAIEHLRIAAASGDRNAMAKLALIYKSSSLTTPDPIESLTYAISEYRLAQSEGLPRAPDYLTRKFKGLTPDQIAAAQSKSDILLAKCCGM